MEELKKRLEKIAHKKSSAFCYLCYQEVLSGWCATCGSDDGMRFVREIGCEYGYDWIVRHLLEENLETVNVDEAFEESVRECYPETTQVAWMTLDTVTIAKEADPVSWRLAQSEWEDNECSDERLLTFDNGSTYYWSHDVERYVEEQEAELEAAG